MMNDDVALTVDSPSICMYVRLGVTKRRSPLMFYILSSE